MGWEYQYLITSSSLKSWCKDGRSLSCAARRRRRRVLMVPSWRMMGGAMGLFVCPVFFSAVYKPLFWWMGSELGILVHFW